MATDPHNVLVTDSLFINDRHFARMEAAGLRPIRLDEPKASADQLIEHLAGKRGYIIGGTERVTDEVISAANDLVAVVFTGAGYREYIPAHEQATRRGIAIANTPGTNATAVSEYTLSLMLLMTRNLLGLGRTGDMKFSTTKSLSDSTVGIIGMGSIGQSLARRLRALGVRGLKYTNRTRRYSLESELDMPYATLEELLADSDIISVHTAAFQDSPLLNKADLARMKEGAIVINAAYPDAVDGDALHSELSSGRLRAAFDAPPSLNFGDLPLTSWFCSNSPTAFNTASAINFTSDVATESMISLLSGAFCQNIVNPDFANYRK